MTWRSLLVVLVTVPAARLAAQSPTAQLGLGIQAYRDLDMIAAVRELRVALAADGDGALDREARKQALTYLAAAELYRDRRDSAVVAFRRVVDLDPRYVPDPLVFSPDVVDLFRDVQRSTPAVSVSAPHRATFGAAEPGLPILLHANVRHTVVVTAETVLGEVVDTLHRGPVGDSLMLRWTGRGRGRRTVPSGGMVLGVMSLDRQGKPIRRVELPLQVARGPAEPLETPSPPTLLPERQRWGKPIGRLTVGLGLAAMSALVFPEITGSDAAGVATGLVFTAGGIIGFAESRPGKPLPENVAANAIARARWRAQVDAIERANRTRADGPAVTVEVGEPVVRRGALR
jgi:hypothetical protein